MKPREPKTDIRIYIGDGLALAFHYRADKVAHWFPMGGGIKIVFTDGEVLTFGPAWLWTVSEVE